MGCMAPVDLVHEDPKENDEDPRKETVGRILHVWGGHGNCILLGGVLFLTTGSQSDDLIVFRKRVQFMNQIMGKKKNPALK